MAVALARPQAADPLKSPECGQAVQQLEAARANTAPGNAGVEALRRQAARTCLGTAAPPARPGRVLQAPVVVPPPVVQLGPPPRPASPSPPPAPVRIDRPATVTGCDPGGCWVDDGTRLRHVAPNVVGPNGPCALVAGVVRCP